MVRHFMVPSNDCGRASCSLRRAEFFSTSQSGGSRVAQTLKERAR